jgi:hypothetical protein
MRLDRDLVPRPPRRVAPTVPALVVEEHVGQRRREGAHSGDQPRALDGVGANLGELRLVERSGLGEHLRPDVHLADVVERRAQVKLLEPLAVPAETERHRLCMGADPRRVRFERRVADAHGGGEGLELRHGE